jgi:hypothetical protein
MHCGASQPARASKCLSQTRMLPLELLIEVDDAALGGTHQLSRPHRR